MEGFTILIATIMLVFGVLQIILFFKLWGMTNNVSRVLLILEKQTGLKWVETGRRKVKHYVVSDPK